MPSGLDGRVSTAAGPLERHGSPHARSPARVIATPPRASPGRRPAGKPPSMPPSGPSAGLWTAPRAPVPRASPAPGRRASPATAVSAGGDQRPVSIGGHQRTVDPAVGAGRLGIGGHLGTVDVTVVDQVPHHRAEDVDPAVRPALRNHLQRPEPANSGSSWFRWQLDVSHALTARRPASRCGRQVGAGRVPRNPAAAKPRHQQPGDVISADPDVPAPVEHRRQPLDPLAPASS